MSGERGYRCIVISPAFITAFMRGPWPAECLDHVPEDLEVEDVRMTDTTGGNVEVLLSSPEFNAACERLHPTDRWEAPAWVLTYRARARA